MTFKQSQVIKTLTGTPIRGSFGKQMFASAIGLALLSGCASLTPTSPQTTTTSSQTSSEVVRAPIHISYAGGGFRAHTSHTGWTVALLGNGKRDLASTFANVDSLSSNSGGSWFTTMLFYSDDFQRDLTNGGTRWLAQQKFNFNTLYNASERSNCTTLLKTVGMGNDVGAAPCIIGLNYNFNWRKFVADEIYAPYQLDLAGKTLASSPLRWAMGKTLLLATTLLKDNVVVGGTGTTGDKFYNWFCNEKSRPVMSSFTGSGDLGGTCKPKTALATTNVIAATLSNLPDSKAPNFLKGAGSQTQYTIGYARNVFHPTSPVIRTTNIRLNQNYLDVISAASASSAATGFLASEKVSGLFLESYELENLAVSFSFFNPTRSTTDSVEYIDTAGMTLNELINRRVVRMADGGVVDNTGIAQLVSYLQAQKGLTSFEVVAFDDIIQHDAYGLGTDMQHLLGLTKSPPKYSFQGISVAIPDLQIFQKPTPSSPPRVVWSMPIPSKICPGALFYSVVDVITKANPALDIKAGSNVRLHVFSSFNKNSRAAPFDLIKDFTCYEDILREMPLALQKSNGVNTGLFYLENALGL